MKKYLTIILSLLISFVCFASVKAEDDYIFDNDGLLTLSEIDELNEKLGQIEEEYSLGIYFVHDESIDSSSGSYLVEYGDAFLEENGIADNNIALLVNEQYYYICASGPKKDTLLSIKDQLWEAYIESSTTYEGVKNYYQSVLSILNVNPNFDPSGVIDSNATYLNDYAGLLSESEKNTLNEQLKSLSDEYNLDVVVVTVNSLNGSTVVDYADDYYDYNNYRADGILLLVAMSEREWSISTKGLAVDYFTDYGLSIMEDDMLNYLSDGDYYEAFNRFKNDVKDFIDYAKEDAPIDIDNQVPERFSGKHVVIAAGVALFVTAIVAIIITSNMKSVHNNYFAGNYVVANSFILTGSSDWFINKTVSRTRRPKVERSSGSHGGGGSSTHISHSGSSHGGRSGHF